MGFTTAEKKKIAAQSDPRYRKAGKGGKSRILDEYPALSGRKSRKYAVFKLNRIGKTHLRLPDGQTVAVKIIEKAGKNGPASRIMTHRPQLRSNCSGKTSPTPALNDPPSG